MKNFRKNKSVLIRNKIIHLNISDNKKSLFRNKTSIFYFNKIPDTNGSKHINLSYFNQKPDFYNSSFIQMPIEFLLTNIKKNNSHIKFRNTYIFLEKTF